MAEFIRWMSPATYGWICDEFRIPYLDSLISWFERQLRKFPLIWAVLMERDRAVRRVAAVRRTELPAIKRPNNPYAPLAVFLVNMQMEPYEAMSKTEKGKFLITKQGEVLTRSVAAEIPIVTILRPKAGPLIPKLREDGKIKTSIVLGDGKLLPQQVWSDLKEGNTKTVVLMGINADQNIQGMATQLIQKGYRVMLCAELAMNGPDFVLKNGLRPYQWFSKNSCYHQYLSSIVGFIR